MDASSLTFAADRLNRERAAALDRENEILRSIADRGVGITPESPAGRVGAGLGVWFRNVFRMPRRPRFA